MEKWQATTILEDHSGSYRRQSTNREANKQDMIEI